MSVYAESPLQGKMEPRFVLDAFVTLVCSGPDGMPQTLPFSLKPSDPLETRRMEVRPKPYPNPTIYSVCLRV